MVPLKLKKVGDGKYVIESMDERLRAREVKKGPWELKRFGGINFRSYDAPEYVDDRRLVYLRGADTGNDHQILSIGDAQYELVEKAVAELNEYCAKLWEESATPVRRTKEHKAIDALSTELTLEVLALDNRITALVKSDEERMEQIQVLEESLKEEQTSARRGRKALRVMKKLRKTLIFGDVA